MDSFFLVTVFGLLLATSGSARRIFSLSQSQLSTEAQCAVQKNGAIAAYRRLAEKTANDNIALSPIDALSSLSTLYGWYNEMELHWFFDSFEADPNRTAAVEKYTQMFDTLDQSPQKDAGKLMIDHIKIFRSPCRKNNTAHAAVAALQDNGFIVRRLQTAMSFMKGVYRRMKIDIKIDQEEFGGKECVFMVGGSSFRQDWQQHHRCVLESKFYPTLDTFKDGVKYTRVIGDFPAYGELPELNAKYIEVPWTANSNMNETYHLFVILPNDVDGLPELERRITGRRIQRMIDQTGKTKVDATLPEISVTRKYHLLSMMRKVSPDSVLRDDYDTVSAVKFDIFRASADRCSNEGSISPDIPRFNADHPFLVVLVASETEAELSVIVDMLGYRTAEQAQNSPK